MSLATDEVVGKFHWRGGTRKKNRSYEQLSWRWLESLHLHRETVFWFIDWRWIEFSWSVMVCSGIVFSDEREWVGRERKRKRGRKICCGSAWKVTIIMASTIRTTRTCWTFSLSSCKSGFDQWSPSQSDVQRSPICADRTRTDGSNVHILGCFEITIDPIVFRNVSLAVFSVHCEATGKHDRVGGEAWRVIDSSESGWPESPSKI